MNDCASVDNVRYIRQLQPAISEALLGELADLVAARIIEHLSPLRTDRLWSTEDVAAYIGCHWQTVRRHVKRGHLPKGVKIGDQWFWEPEEVKEHLRERKGQKPRRGRGASRQLRKENDT